MVLNSRAIKVGGLLAGAAVVTAASGYAGGRVAEATGGGIGIPMDGKSALYMLGALGGGLAVGFGELTLGHGVVQAVKAREPRVAALAGAAMLGLGALYYGMTEVGARHERAIDSRY